MVSTSGAKLLPESALTAMRDELFPLTTLLTPNIPEANALWAHMDIDPPPIHSLADFQNYVESLFAVIDCEWLLVKGGHLPFTASGFVASSARSSEVVVDILYGPRSLAPSPTLLRTQYQDSRHTHGTGCSLACKPTMSATSKDFFIRRLT
jgi:hydroxymethylpyrimidine/phosphomethylpyrimidine kinase